MFSHSTRDLSAIRFHLLDALILTLLGVTVCPIVHSPSTFAPCYKLRPVQRSSFYCAGAQRGDPQYAAPQSRERLPSNRFDANDCIYDFLA
jgi:hypothetical protein